MGQQLPAQIRHMGKKTDSSARMLDAAWLIVAEGGPLRLTFDAIAARLGVSKQAVLYWFPTKSHLMAALVLPALRAEAGAVTDACAQGGPAAVARRRALTALAAFHLADLDRFRLIYLAAQTGPGVNLETTPEAVAELHRITDGLYTELAHTVTARPKARARRAAVAMHAAVIGVLTMIALGHSIGDPMKHAGMDQINALLDHLC